MGRMIDDDMLESLAGWLDESIGVEEIRHMLPAQHPAAVWWTDLGNGCRSELDTLLKVLANGGHLPLLVAIVLLARAASGKQPPAGVDVSLGQALIRLDADHLRANAAAIPECHTDVFVCYAHEDALRVNAICEVLRTAGLSVFRDTESIRPGTSIAASVAQAALVSHAAIIVVSEASRASRWVERETSRLMLRRMANSLALYPVVIDNVPMPEALADVFAIDLRGMPLLADANSIAPKLAPMLQEIVRRRAI
jgi:hypothetical protein